MNNIEALIKGIEETAMFTEEGDSVLYEKQAIDLIRKATEGMALLPIEPTEAMRVAYFAAIDLNRDRLLVEVGFGRSENFAEAYAAMLSTQREKEV